MNFNPKINLGTLYTTIITFAFIGTCTIVTSQSMPTRACPCPDREMDNNGRQFVVCDALTNTIDTNQLISLQSACFQGPIQLCSGAFGLDNPVLDGLWIIGSPNQPADTGLSTVQVILRRALNCTGAAVTIDFNQQTADPADAFTLLKTIQPGDSLQFTQINPATCEVVTSVNACAADVVTGCGPVFSVTVFNTSGLTALYNTVNDYVSLLNFGSKPGQTTQANALLNASECTNCPAPALPDLPCWPAQVCSGLISNFIPTACLSGGGTNMLLNANHLEAVTTIAVPKTTNGFSVSDIVCSTRVGDRLRVYTPGISNVTPLNTPLGQLGWATALSGLFGPTILPGDYINDVAIDSQGNIIVVGNHTPSNTALNTQFAAAQLIPTISGDVTLGWFTALSGVFGQSTGIGDLANGVAIDSNDNIIIGGVHEPFSGPIFNGPQLAAVQLMPDGTLAWATTIINPFGNPDPINGTQANDVILDVDGGIILAGFYDPRFQVATRQPRFIALKLGAGSNGTIVDWTFQAPDQLFGTVNTIGARARGVALDRNNNIILAGLRVAPGGSRFMAALQLIPNGPNAVNLGWFTALVAPFSAQQTDEANAVTVDCNNNVILAGLHDAFNTPEFAALQLKQGGTGIILGWTTPNPFRPFGPVDVEGDEARDILIDHNNTIIVAGFHTPPSEASQCAAVQLIPNESDNIDVGWTASLSAPFGPTVDQGDRANAIALQTNNNLVLGGFHNATAGSVQFASLQLKQSLVPSFADYTITAINMMDDFILFEVALIDSENGIICSGQDLCITDLGFCCG